MVGADYRQLFFNLISALLFLPVGAQYQRLYGWYFRNAGYDGDLFVLVEQIMQIICVIGISFAAILTTIMLSRWISGSMRAGRVGGLRLLALIAAQGGVMGFLILSHSGGPANLHCGLCGAVLLAGVVLLQRRGEVGRLIARARPEAFFFGLLVLAVALEICRLRLVG